MPDVLSPRRTIETATRRHIGFDPDNGFHARLRGSFVEIYDAVHDTVVGYRHRRLVVGLDRSHQVLDPGGTIEHREFRMNV